MEEALVNFLQDDDTSSDGILELEPMNSYNRLLLHRLAEIFGFAHESVGEGDDRHLILERCPDTSIPPILVSDILWEYDEPQSLVTSHQILRRKEASSVSQENTSSVPQSLEERKAAYLLARERIFSMNLEEVKEPNEQKPRSVPAVARRMIAHALGQRIHNGLARDSMKDKVLTDDFTAKDKNSEESNLVEDLRRNSTSKLGNSSSSNAASLNKRNHQTPTNKDLPQKSQDGKQGHSVSKEYMKKEHIGAAKRMFAHALGVQPGKDGSVEELAFLVKDNLPCKHLVLTMEEALVNFLQDDDTSSDGILELEPMNSYNRLLLHRLAEIFGFAHESVGEGDDRHLILERCPDTSIPPILVSDILWEYDEPQSLVTSHQILRRKEASSVSQENTSSVPQSLEERKAAYLLARERIFSMNLEEVKEPNEQKPRSVPAVARRMIAHALGQRIHNGLARDSMKDKVLTDDFTAKDKNSEESNLVEDLRRNSTSKLGNSSSSNAASLNKRNHQTPTNKDLPQKSQDGKQGHSVSKEYMKKEHIGAAKRMFAHALGVQPGKDGSVPRSRNGETKRN
ncbi:hypothetical protein TanjilG_10159 [Lupinus angustifolius]|uniref:R3H domain-containing protein n=1 Tax=Lupinus angustifolius TaxID=3871 RepID=A0A1J7HL77_LUPAN|nr:hypothetical protein TanjilG_10159 [Lupinus angustifolius]